MCAETWWWTLGDLIYKEGLNLRVGRLSLRYSELDNHSSYSRGPKGVLLVLVDHWLESVHRWFENSPVEV